jgi:hypothetical protein
MVRLCSAAAPLARRSYATSEVAASANAWKPANAAQFASALPRWSASNRKAIVNDCTATQATATPPDTTPSSWLATTTKIAAVTTSRANHTMAIAVSDWATRNASPAPRRLVGVRHVTTNAARNAIAPIANPSARVPASSPRANATVVGSTATSHVPNPAIRIQASGCMPASIPISRRRT